MGFPVIGSNYYAQPVNVNQVADINKDTTSTALEASQASEKQNNQPTNCAINGKTVVTSVATALATGVHKAGLGAKILHHGAALAGYSKTITALGRLGAYRPVQYLAAQTANKAGAALVSTAVCGTTLGALATAGTAILTAVTVAQAGAIIHNAFIAKTEQDKISLNPVGMIKQGYNAIAAAAA